MPFAATSIQLEIIIRSEVRKRNTIWYHLCVKFKIWHKWNYLRNRNRIRDIENRLVVAEGERSERRLGLEFGIRWCKLVYTEWINNKILLYSTGNYIQCLVVNHNGKNMKKNVCVCVCVCVCVHIYMYIWVTLLYNSN